MAARRMLATIIMGSLLALTAPAGTVAAAPAARLPRLMIGDVVVSEGDSPGSLRPAVLPVTLSEPVPTPVTFDYATDNHTDFPPIAGVDFVPTSGTVTIAAGRTWASIVVQVKGSPAPGPAGPIVVLFSNVSGNVRLADLTGSVGEPSSAEFRPDAFVRLRPLPAGATGLSVSDVTVYEPDDPAAVLVVATVMLPRTPSTPVRVDYRTVDGTATAPADYLSRTGTVTITPPARAARIQLWVRGDREIDDGTFTVAISSPDAPVDDPDGTVTILDGDDSEVVDLATDGQAARPRTSEDPAISADGSVVAFVSSARLVRPGDTNGVADIYVRDLGTATTTRVSVSSSGREADGPSGGRIGHAENRPVDVSGDGRFVVFTSEATNLIDGEVSARLQIYLHDRSTGQTTRLSQTPAGTRGFGDSYAPSISDDGRYVAYTTFADNLAPGPGAGNCVVLDRTTGVTRSLSVAPAGGQNRTACDAPEISADGRVVIFSTARSLDGDPSSVTEKNVWAYDLTTDTVERLSDSFPSDPGGSISQLNLGLSVSGDGRYVLFMLVPMDAPQEAGTFLHDRVEHATVKLFDFASTAQLLSRDGRYVVGRGQIYDRSTGRFVLMASGFPGDVDADFGTVVTFAGLGGNINAFHPDHDAG